MSDPSKRADGNEGEGSRTADRQYREDLKRFVEQHDVEELAREAERDVATDPEGYREAEEAGKRRIAEEDPALHRKG